MSTVFHRIPRVPIDLEKVHNYSRLSRGLSEHQSSEVKVLVGALDDDLRDYDNDITQLEIQLSFLKNQRTRAKNYRKFLGSLCSPFHRLPNELLGEIFQEVCNDVHVEPWGKYDVSVAPFVLSAVCNRWREFVVGNPKLWTTIRFRCPLEDPEYLSSAQYERLQEVVDLYIERSTTFHLKVQLFSSPDHEESGLFQYFLTSSPRWKCLSLYVTSLSTSCYPTLRLLDLPVLETVSIHHCLNSGTQVGADLSVFNNAPKLHTLDVLEGGLSTTSNSTVLDQLTTFTYKTSFGNLTEVLRLCPNLQYLTLTDQRPSDPFAPELPITAPKLTSISVIFGRSYLNRSDMLQTAFLSSLTAPALTTLSLALEQVQRDPRPLNALTRTSESIFRGIDNFIIQSHCKSQLTKLVLDGMPLEDKDLVSLLKTLPFLEELTVIDPCNGMNRVLPISKAFVQSLHSCSKTSHLQTSDITLVPNLHTLTLKVVAPGFDHDAFVETILSRWCPANAKPPKDLSPLRRVNLSLSEPINEEDYKLLFALRRSGLLFSVELETLLPSKDV
ncbi:hypothetical protein C8J55DRAFT_517832 [Lentinula edodes]|uniref:F-box domain-containing protein n=1 Tax=Lentinula lateritia TaxID=40482 RepID=A0A9W9A7A2_9AGAR|nr:hypothetical protein C8J55DRAFT_517832 [Lentinula edodes]